MSVAWQRGRYALAVGLAIVGALLLPALARADGDPGSDVLYQQNLFAGADAGVSISQQVRLGKLLDATAAAGAPVRVAIIAKRDDLGTVTPLWGDPQLYAKYLGEELSLVYTGRLLVVMPNGYGVLDFHTNGDNRPPQLSKAISGLPAPGASTAGLVAGAMNAVDALEAAAGVPKTELAHDSSASSVLGTTKATPTSSAATTTRTHRAPGVIFGIVVVLALIAYIAWRRGWKPKLPERRRRGESEGRGESRKRLRIKPVALLPTLLLLIVVAALVINHLGSASSQPVSDLANNPQLDPGTQLTPRAAAKFTLTDESGQPISLSQYRGKVVILSFIDAECQTICPLTTQAMLYAKHSLGAAGEKDVQLLGIDANWKSTQIDDVLNYTELHGLLGQWHFLTGTLKQLDAVWSAYGVNEKALTDPDSNEIDHVAATYVIDPQGRVRAVYTTQPSYAAVPQLGQVLAQEASKLLPSRPGVSTHYSYSEVGGISPAQTTTLPKLGGGSVTLGPGAPHLYLFFATWDTQTTPIAGELSEMNEYDQYARAHGLPTLTAIDEGSVEPSSGALPAFLKTVPTPLQYPVAIDQTGRVSDGYEVQGDPWFVLTSAGGQIAWYQEIYTAGWPTLAELEGSVKVALSKTPKVPHTLAAALDDLKGSPPVLAALHKQASDLLTSGSAGLEKRIAGLRGHPVVVNVWGSWCTPCQQEFPLFAQASALYGKKVAFIGADYNDQAGNARAFLRTHPVSYPSYATSLGTLDALLPGGLEATPTTIYISPAGKVLYVHIGQYDTQGSLDGDIEDYALGGAG